MKESLFAQVKKLMAHVEGSNNYEVTSITVYLYTEGMEVESACRNEYGGLYENDDRQFIGWENVPNKVMRELMSLGYDSVTLEEWEWK